MGQNLVEEFITKEYKYAVSTVLEKALKGEKTANFEFPLITKHDVQIEVLLNATMRQDEQGNIIRMQGLVKKLYWLYGTKKRVFKAHRFGECTYLRCHHTRVCQCMKHMHSESSQLQHRGGDGSFACPGIYYLGLQSCDTS